MGGPLTAGSAHRRRAVGHRSVVTVTALLEGTADNPKFAGNTNPSQEVPHTAQLWPAAAREPGASMHAKILVIDRSSALVGSANLTGIGVERNLECGVLIRGGSMPGDLARYIGGALGIES